MRSSIALAAIWRTGSRNVKRDLSPTEPRPPRCAPINSGYGSPPSPMFSLARSGTSASARTVSGAACGRDPAQAPQARRPGPHQRAPHQVRPRLVLSLRRPMASRRRSPGLKRRRDADKSRQSTPQPTGDPKQSGPIRANGPKATLVHHTEVTRSLSDPDRSNPSIRNAG